MNKEGLLTAMTEPDISSVLDSQKICEEQKLFFYQHKFFITSLMSRGVFVSYKVMFSFSENVSLFFKFYCLTVMTFVAAAYIVALRYTRTTSAVLYFSTTAVCITEVIKLFLSLGILAK